MEDEVFVEKTNVVDNVVVAKNKCGSSPIGTMKVNVVPMRPKGVSSRELGDDDQKRKGKDHMTDEPINKNQNKDDNLDKVIMGNVNHFRSFSLSVLLFGLFLVSTYLVK